MVSNVTCPRGGAWSGFRSEDERTDTGRDFDGAALDRRRDSITIRRQVFGASHARQRPHSMVDPAKRSTTMHATSKTS